MNVLVVVSHRDDELACAGSLARHVEEGDRVTISYLGSHDLVGRGDPTGRWIIDSAKDVRRVLGSEYFPVQLFPDNRFDTVPLLGVVMAVESALAYTSAEVVYCPSASDLNIDHSLTYRAVVTATRPVPGQRVKRVLAMEMPSATEWFYGQIPFMPNYYVPLTEAQMDKKREAIACYQGEMRSFPHARSVEAFDALARLRGSQCGHLWAEAFQLVREIRA